LFKPNLPYLLWRYGGNASRTLRAFSRRYVYPDIQCFADRLLDQGILVGPSDQFLSDQGREALVDASESVLKSARSDDVRSLVQRGSSDRDKKNFLVELVKWEEEHSLDSPLLRLALDRKLLEIISLYLGMFPRLHAIGAWLNFPTEDEAKESQLWHRDGDDLQLMKVFIYLNDVDEACGPFSYVPETQPFGAKAAAAPKRESPGRVTDRAMNAVIPRQAWLACTGPKHTMILADTRGYHRGGKPMNGNRILITFTYTSGTPLKKRKYRLRPSLDKQTWIKDDIQRYAL
jgi:hypothetical protein